MKVLSFFIAFLFANIIFAHAYRFIRQTETTTPSTYEDDEQMSIDEGTECDLDSGEGEVQSRGQLAAELFPETISVDRVRKIFKRGLEILENRQLTRSRKRQCVLDDVDQDAINTIRWLAGDDAVSSEASSQSTISQPQSQESSGSCPNDVLIDGTSRRVSIETMQNILRLHRDGQSEKSIKGKYRWFSRQYIPRFESRLESNQSRFKYEQIDNYVWLKVEDALNNKLPVHDYMIRNWGLERADQIGASRFTGSHTWVLKFKKRHDYVGRKVTGYESRAEAAQQDDIAASKLRFVEAFRLVRNQFPFNRIVNVDQSDFKYEKSNLRVIARKGDRDVVIRVDSKNKNTHSYTLQPMIARDGTLAGKLLICLHEDKDEFGPRIEPKVRRIESDLGNVVVIPSTSGKMTSRLIQEWLNSVVEPEMQRRLEQEQHEYEEVSSDGTELYSLSSSGNVIEEPQPGPSWASNPLANLTEEQRNILAIRNTSVFRERPRLLLLADAWGGHSSQRIADDLAGRHILELKIPKHTTGYLQPLDVNFFRQYKRFWKLLTERALYEGSIQNITSRLGVINMNGMIWNQFSAPVYRDMILYAWRHTDPLFEIEELDVGPRPRMVDDIQFKFNRSHFCEVEGCSNRAFIRCSHCQRHLCLDHFLGRACFHRGNDTAPARPYSFERDDDDDTPGAGATRTGPAVGSVAIAAGTASLGVATGAATGAVAGSVAGAFAGTAGAIAGTAGTLAGTAEAVAGAAEIGAGAAEVEAIVVPREDGIYANLWRAVTGTRTRSQVADDQIPLIEVEQIPKPVKVEVVASRKKSTDAYNWLD